jgi:hypothetical protein
MINLPGYELIAQGLEDLRNSKDTFYSALLYSAETRLSRIGIILDGNRPDDPSMCVYKLLENEFGNGAHSKFNALNRRLLSFCKAREMEIRNSLPHAK